MSLLSDDQLEWGLGCVNHPAPRQHSIVVTIDVSPEERARISASIHYLHSFRRTAYTELLKAVDAYWQRKQVLAAALDQRTFQQESERTPLSDAFTDVLNRFKEYLDHTRFRLSRRYGKGSSELAGFDAECSRQYDASFGYRLFGQLRNEALHKQRVISVSATGRVTPDGRRERIVETTVADEVLDEAGAPGSEWNRRVADELLSLGRPVYVDPLLNELTTAVTRIEAFRLLLEKPRVEREIAFVRETAARVQCLDGEPSLIGGFVDRATAPAGRVTMRILPLSPELCSDLEKMMASAAELASQSAEG
jgi:hypothetical protein